ncbi:MAG: hypothetical protein IJY42_05240 [Clostridia bacterium]|nr:hypothetical protein [Clostridia bacterium]
MGQERDRSIVRELARKYMELVCSEKQKKIFQRQRDTNDLKIVRPPVILAEIPWYQMNMDDELTLICEDARARKAELFFRKALFYMKHFKADNKFEPYFRLKRAVDSTGTGLEITTSEIKRTDSKNNIISHEYEDVLEDESALEKMHDPEFTLRPDRDAEAMEYYTELLGDTIPVRLYGFGYLYNAPWDIISMLRGVEPILMDMYDRPEYLHAIMKKFVSATMAELDFVEKYLDVDNDFADLHCTSGLVSGKAETGLKATWYRGMAQTLGVISPAMFKEFEVDYILPITRRFAYTYYGCCEPLDDRIEILKAIPNLRKLGCSPWANVEKCAEQIGGDYVLSRKPNPANVAIKTDPEVIQREIEETVKACIRHGCPYDITLKDISTVSHRPENLIVWAKTVSDVLDRYYGEA